MRVGVTRRSPQEITDAFSDIAGMRFEREVAGVEEADNRARIVALERLGLLALMESANRGLITRAGSMSQ